MPSSGGEFCSQMSAECACTVAIEEAGSIGGLESDLLSALLMWAGISIDGKTELLFVPGGGRVGGLTSDRYISEILLEQVVPYAGYIGDDFLLMHDNARCHTSRATAEFLGEVGIATLYWPALSPDLNPIEHLWDELKRRVRSRNPAPSNVTELKSALTEEWEGIAPETVKKLIRSMTNRLRAVIRARGGNTKY